VRHHAEDESNEQSVTTSLLLKIKPLDREVIEGLHLMAGAVNSRLADLLYEHRESLEYRNCHAKEITLYELLHRFDIRCIPEYHGRRIEQEREIYLFVQELLDSDQLLIFNSENNPELWDRSSTMTVIRSITDVHRRLATPSLHDEHPHIEPFHPWNAAPLYRMMLQLSAEYHHDLLEPEEWEKLDGFVDDLRDEHDALAIPRTIIHNDFNPRNIAMRSTGVPCIYDWELSVIDIPHRDIVELLSFTLIENFTADEFEEYLSFHYELCADDPQRPEPAMWRRGYSYALKEYLVSRVSFYLVGDIVTRYEFAGRILKNSLRMIELTERDEG
jgi:hydroxymethylglutaryl-CoA reductase (NADPH)